MSIYPIFGNSFTLLEGGKSPLVIIKEFIKFLGGSPDDVLVEDTSVKNLFRKKWCFMIGDKLIPIEIVLDSNSQSLIDYKKDFSNDCFKEDSFFINLEAKNDTLTEKQLNNTTDYYDLLSERKSEKEKINYSVCTISAKIKEVELNRVQDMFFNALKFSDLLIGCKLSLVDYEFKLSASFLSEDLSIEKLQQSLLLIINQLSWIDSKI